jgi:hypothetical protein
VGEHRTTLPFDHQIPHWGYCRLAPPLVGDLSIVRNEVKLTAAVVKASLLDFMAAQFDTRWNETPRSGGWLRARNGPPDQAGCPAREM